MLDRQGQFINSKEAARLLLHHKEKTFSDWALLMGAKLQGFKTHSPSEQINSISKIVNLLVHTLNQEPSSTSVDLIAFRISEHSEEPNKLEYCTLGQVILEYHLLRKLLLKHLEAEARLDTHCREVFDEFFERKIQEAVEKHFEILEVREAADQTIVETERVELSSSKQRLTKALENARMNTWEIDLKTGHSTISGGFAALFGDDVQEGSPFEVIRKFIHTDDAESAALVLKSSIDNLESYSDEYRINRNGFVRWIMSRGDFKYSDSGEPITLSGIVTDITDQKELSLSAQKARERLYSTLMDAPVLLSVYRGKDLHIDFANRKFRSVVGVGRNIEGVRLEDAFPDVSPELLALQKRVFETGEAYISHEMPALLDYDRNGSPYERVWDVIYQPTFDKDGKVDGVLACATEVTAHVRARLLLEKTNQELIQEREMREIFVAALTHDLRTPMTAAKVSGQLIIRKTDDPELVRALSTRIVKNMDRADEMIRDLLDAGRIKAGEGIPLTLSPCCMNDIFETTLKDLVHSFGTRFVLKSSEEKINGYWDANAIQRILENLCGNAVKYGNEEANITLSFFENANGLEISVHNEGAPIPLEDQSTLFTPYRRTSSALASDTKGWGIGLTLVKGLVEAHGGSIWVESSAEKGTTFRILIGAQARERSQS